MATTKSDSRGDFGAVSTCNDMSRGPLVTKNGIRYSNLETSAMEAAKCSLALPPRQHRHVASIDARLPPSAIISAKNKQPTASDGAQLLMLHVVAKPGLSGSAVCSETITFAGRCYLSNDCVETFERMLAVRKVLPSRAACSTCPECVGPITVTDKPSTQDVIHMVFYPVYFTHRGASTRQCFLMPRLLCLSCGTSLLKEARVSPAAAQWRQDPPKCCLSLHQERFGQPYTAAPVPAGRLLSLWKRTGSYSALLCYRKSHSFESQIRAIESKIFAPKQPPKAVVAHAQGRNDDHAEQFINDENRDPAPSVLWLEGPNQRVKPETRKRRYTTLLASTGNNGRVACMTRVALAPPLSTISTNTIVAGRPRLYPTVQELEAAGTARKETNLQKWYTKLRLYHNYIMDNHGNSHIPASYKIGGDALGSWVSIQRTCTKRLLTGKVREGCHKDAFTKEKFEALQSIGAAFVVAVNCVHPSRENK